MNSPENRDITGGDACKNRADTGRFMPGVSGNPGGRPKDEHRIAELAREHAPAAIRKLVALIEHEDPRVSLAACQAVLDRGYGKPRTAEVFVADGAAGHKITRVIVGWEGDPPHGYEHEGGGHG